MGNLYYKVNGRRRDFQVSNGTAYLLLVLIFTAWAGLMALIIMALTSAGYLPSFVAAFITSALSGYALRIND